MCLRKWLIPIYRIDFLKFRASRGTSSKAVDGSILQRLTVGALRLSGSIHCRCRAIATFGPRVMDNDGGHGVLN